MNLALILFLGGVVVIAWIAFTASRRPDRLTEMRNLDAIVPDIPAAARGDAVLVSHLHGKLLYVNEPARRLLNMNGDAPHLENIARMAQPADNFLGLFAGEGQSSFQLGDRWVEASSHRIPADGDLRTVVVIRELTAATSNPDVLDMGQAMALINEIGETINAGMGLEQVLQVLLTVLGKSLNVDAGEICLWDEETRTLNPRGWVGDTRYLLDLQEAGGVYGYDEGLSGWIAHYRKPILLTGQDESLPITPKLESNPYTSFAAVPLELGDRFIGTLEIANLEANAYTTGDLALLQAMSKPSAVAIYNAEIYAEQVRRVQDLAMLQEVVASDASNEADSSTIYRTLNRRIAGLVSADMCGIFLYDPERGGLVPQLPFIGLPDALAQTIFIPLPEDSPQSDIWQRESYWISNDVAGEALVEALGLLNIVEVAGITNTAWLPLQIKHQRLGVLAVSNKRTEGGFTQRDIQNLVILAAQASIVIENMRLFQREQRMDTELVGLQEITNAIGALSHETEFYGEINERIARLMDAAMCGILLYDATNACLRSQLPFHGVDDDQVKHYVIPLESGSVMEQLWEEERYWYSNRVRTDTLVYAAGLDTFADEVGVEKTMIATLFASGQRLGVIQISNKINGGDFTDSDARLLMIFATQVAAIIQNSRLFREVQRSAEEAQGLRGVAELAGNIVTSDDSFAPVLSRIAELLTSELVFINVLDQQKGSVITYPRYVYGMELSEPIIQDINSEAFDRSVILGGESPFYSNDVINDERVVPSYRQIARRMGLNNGAVVPLIYGERTLGEMGVANRHDNVPYTDQDMAIMRIVAAQVAAALDRVLLYEATGQNLSQRLEELDAISRVSNELTLTLDLDRVLEVIREEASKAMNGAYATVVLFTDPAGWTSPETPRLERRLGHAEHLTTLADIEYAAVRRQGDAVIVNDYSASELQAQPVIAESALATGIVYLDQTVGVIHLYHETTNIFDERAAAFLVTLAAKASLGYGNAVRYQEQIERSNRLRRRVEQLSSIFELGHMFQTNPDPIMVLEAIAYSVQTSVGFDTVVMTLVQGDYLHRVAQAGLPLSVFEESRQRVIQKDDLEALLKDDYQISESYFFPVEDVEQWYTEGMSALSTGFEGNRTIEISAENAWRDGDKLFVTMRGASGQILGLMVLDRPHNNQRPDRVTIEVLEIFAHQAATTVENTWLFRSAQRSAEQESLLNEIIEAVSGSLEVSSIVRSLAEGTLRLCSYNQLSVAVVDVDGNGFDILRAVVQSDAELEMMEDRRFTLGESALNRSYVENRDYVYDANDPDIVEYEDLKTWYAAGERTSLVLPLATAGESFGVIHFGLNDTFSLDPVSSQLLRRVAQIAASAIQNARLFNQAVNLQVLNESVVESIQQGIVVLDNSGRIIALNQFLQERYGWEQAAVGQDLFAYQPAMIDLIGDDLRAVLEQGEPQERLNQITHFTGGVQAINNYYLYPLRYVDTIRGAVVLVEDVTERSRLEQAIEARAHQLGALTEVSTRISSSLERGEVVQLALREMGNLIPHNGISLWRRNGSYMLLEGVAGKTYPMPEEDARRFMFSQYPLMKQVVETQRVVAIASAEDASELPIHHDFESWMGVPLVNQGHVVGLMMLSSDEPNAYENTSDHNVAFAFASQVAIAEANADLFEQTFDRTNELGILLEAAQATSLTTDLDSIFKMVVQLMFNAVEMDSCAIMLWHEVDNSVEVQLHQNRLDAGPLLLEKGTRLDLTKYPAKLRALNERDVHVISLDESQEIYAREVEEIRSMGAHARMLVPLVVRDKSMGLVQLEQINSEDAVKQQKVRLARALGSQVAVTIENARLSAETTAHFEESLLLNELSQAVSSTFNLDDMIQVVRGQLPLLTDASELYLALFDPDTEMITFPLAVSSGADYQIEPRSLSNDEVSFIIRRRRPLNLGADYYSPDELRRSMGITNGEGDIMSYLGVPLVAGDQVYGVLAVRDTQRTRAFTINEQRILNTVASQLGAAIQNARLYHQVQGAAEELNRVVAERTAELEDERDRLNTLYQITSELTRTLDKERLMPNALEMVASAVGAEDGIITQLDPMTDQLYSRASLNPDSLVKNPQGHDYHPAEVIARWLIIEDETDLLITDLHDHEMWNADEPGADQWHSALAVLLEANDEPLGVLVLLNSQPNAFNEAHLRLTVAAANQVASSINNAELYKLIRDQAERLGMLLRAEQEGAEKNQAILEGIADGVILTDEAGRIRLFNSAAERILEIPREQALNHTLDQLSGLDSGSLSAWAKALETRLINLEDDSATDYLNERIDLGSRIVSIHLSPVSIDDRFLGTVSVFRDVTREVQAERSKSEFVASVSHEFRTPLTSIKGYNDLLMMGVAGEFTEMQSQMLGKVKDNVVRLAALVEDVLRISTIDAGSERLILNDVDMNNRVAEILENVSAMPRHQQKNHTVLFEPVPDLPAIQADVDKIDQIITNVIDNAFSYTPAGGTITVTLQHEAERERVLLQVSDTGVGIPEEFHESVWGRFERHEQTALDLDVAGTGLGMPIVKEMVMMHRGEVWFESELQVGTTFYIALPVKQPEYLITAGAAAKSRSN